MPSTFDFFVAFMYEIYNVHSVLHEQPEKQNAQPRRRKKTDVNKYVQFKQINEKFKEYNMKRYGEAFCKLVPARYVYKRLKECNMFLCDKSGSRWVVKNISIKQNISTQFDNHHLYSNIMDVVGKIITSESIATTSIDDIISTLKEKLVNILDPKITLSNDKNFVSSFSSHLSTDGSIGLNQNIQITNTEKISEKLKSNPDIEFTTIPQFNKHEPAENATIEEYNEHSIAPHSNIKEPTKKIVAKLVIVDQFSSEKTYQEVNGEFDGPSGVTFKSSEYVDNVAYSNSEKVHGQMDNVQYPTSGTVNVQHSGGVNIQVDNIQDCNSENHCEEANSQVDNVQHINPEDHSDEANIKLNSLEHTNAEKLNNQVDKVQYCEEVNAQLDTVQHANAGNHVEHQEDYHERVDNKIDNVRRSNCEGQSEKLDLYDVNSQYNCETFNVDIESAIVLPSNKVENKGLVVDISNNVTPNMKKDNDKVPTVIKPYIKNLNNKSINKSEPTVIKPYIKNNLKPSIFNSQPKRVLKENTFPSSKIALNHMFNDDNEKCVILRKCNDNNNKLVNGVKAKFGNQEYMTYDVNDQRNTEKHPTKVIAEADIPLGVACFVNQKFFQKPRKKHKKKKSKH